MPFSNCSILANVSRHLYAFCCMPLQVRERLTPFSRFVYGVAELRERLTPFIRLLLRVFRIARASHAARYLLCACL